MPTKGKKIRITFVLNKKSSIIYSLYLRKDATEYLLGFGAPCTAEDLYKTNKSDVDLFGRLCD